MVSKKRTYTNSVTERLDAAEEIPDEDAADESEAGEGEDKRQGQLQLTAHGDGRLKSETPLEQPLQSAAVAPGPLESTAALTGSHRDLRPLDQSQQVPHHGVGEMPVDGERGGRD